MNRRNAIRTALIFSAGATLLPSCLRNDSKDLSLKNISITRDEEKMMAALGETIIPTTNFVGANGVNAYQFTLMMVDDCYPPDDQKKYIDGLHQFNKMVTAKYGKSFTDCNAQQKTEWLTTVQSKKNMPDELNQFYQISKRHILQAFTTSKQYMVDVRHYKMVPGPDYKGCISLKNKVA
jgi:hypothetical protein